jgi:penicillin amidase
MKRVRAVLSLLLAGLAFWALDNRHGTFPALGKLLDPFAGFWQNGEKADELPGTLTVPGLRDEVQVVWDDRRVPHIFAKNDHDLFLAQGYVAASLRLWQMDFQSLFTAGRISEVVGPAGVRHDVFTRRFGLPWAAEKTVLAVRDDAATREIIAAFTAGVNARIRDLGRRGLPVEFKILDYRPEPWTDLKCALLLKAMALVLSTYNQDAALTAMRDALGPAAVETLFPRVPPLVDPVIPPGTPLDFVPVPIPDAAGAVAGEGAGRASAITATDSPARPGAGSNNWAVAGRLTARGFPILCNDMHLELALPAVWYELQLAAPGVNVRGVAFPAGPFVIAGYNEDIAWGYTNGTDDVLDWYAITFKDGSRTEYLYGGEWRKASVREERIRVRGAKAVIDRVVHTHHGPIVLWPEEPPFPNMSVPPSAALRWAGHEPSRVLHALGLLNRARGYADYLAALREWDCPSQNIVYADRTGTIALWHNGKFPLRAKGQGRYVLDGADPANDWKGWVPHGHVPHAKDPECGFVSSANQLPAGEGYPYDLGADFAPFERGARINEILRRARGVSPEDMVRMQADVVDVRARAVMPRLVEVLEGTAATETETKCLEALRSWNFEARAGLVAPTVFRELWGELNRLTWDDERAGAMERMPRPASQIMVGLLLGDPGSPFFDDRTTGGGDRGESGGTVESLAGIAARAFRSAVAKLEARLGPYGERWQWGRAKATQLRHLARLPGFGRETVETDGVSQVINAIDAVWAPSWRMVVELGPTIRAWGNYPGGQSGNPGSRSYDDRIDDWAAGKPDELVFLKSADEPGPRIAGRTVMRGAR